MGLVGLLAEAGGGGIDTTLIDVVNKGGAVALLVLFVIAIVRKWLVPGWVYREGAQREQEWRQLAIGNLDQARQAVNLGEVVASHLSGREKG